MSSQSQDFAYGTGAISPQFDGGAGGSNGNNNDHQKHQQQHPMSAGGSSSRADERQQTTKNSAPMMPMTTVINVADHQETGYNIDRKLLPFIYYFYYFKFCKTQRAYTLFVVVVKQQ